MLYLVFVVLSKVHTALSFYTYYFILSFWKYTLRKASKMSGDLLINIHQAVHV